MRQRDIDDFRAGIAQPGQALLPHGFDLGGHIVRPVFARHADAQAFDATAAGGGEIWHGEVGGRAVFRVVAGHGAEQDGAILHGAGDRAGLIQRGGERDHAPARAAAISRLDAGDTAETGGLADGAAGIGGGGAECEAGGDSGGGATGRATGHQLAVIASAGPRVDHRAEGGGGVGGAHRELIQIGLAEEDGTIAQQIGRDRAFVRRHERFQNAAGRGGAYAGGAEQILDGQRNAGERAVVAARQRRIGGGGLGTRQVRGDSDEGVQHRVQRVDRGEEVVGEFQRRHVALAQRGAGAGQGEIGDHYSTTFGTVKKSPSRSGALASTRSG